jgi:hypothetical protein
VTDWTLGEVDHQVDPFPGDSPRQWTFLAGAVIARERAQGRCEVCAAARDDQTHHRQPRGMGGVSRAGRSVNSPAALLRLCTACHHRIEHQRTWAKGQGLLVPRPTDPASVPARLRTANGDGWYLLDAAGGYTWCDLPDGWSAWAA